MIIFVISLFILILPALVYTQCITVWSQRYDSGNWDQGYGITMDGSGFVYVTGYGDHGGAGLDIVTLKYNALNGICVWTQIKDSGFGDDNGMAIIADSYGYIYVSGYKNNGANSDIFTMKIDPVTHTNIWTNQYNSGNSEHAEGIGMDSAGYLYITGYRNNGANDDFITFKYDPMDGHIIWTQVYNSGQNEQCNEIDAFHSDFLSITGDSFNGLDRDYVTIRYSTNGTSIWTQRFDSGGNDVPMALAIDHTGNIYVSGAKNGATDEDWFTIKYDASGTTLWTQQIDGGGIDSPRCVFVDHLNYVYITGKKNDLGLADIFTIKLDPQGNTIWTQGWNSGNGEDYGSDIIVDQDGYIYIAARAMNASADMDIFTIKYLQAPYPKPSSLKFSSSGKHLKLMWQDNTINEEGFKIYRSFSGTNFQLIGTTPQNTSAFVDTTANIELEYQYKIVATNQAGILASDIFSYTFSGIMGNKTGVFPNYIDVSGDQSCRIVIGENDSVEIKIYDVKGNLVKLFPRQPYQAGGYQVWDGSIQGGKKTGSGIYLIKIQGDRINREFKLIIKK